MEDVDGECEMLAKKAMIANFRGDAKLANDYAAAYLGIRERPVG